MKQETQESYLFYKGRGQKEIYLVTIEGLDFLFRPLVYSEHTTSIELEKILPAHDVNEWLCRQVILYPHTEIQDTFFNSCKPGRIDVFADQIIKVSGFSDENGFINTLHEKRKDFMESIDNLLMAQICTAMPSMNPDVIRGKTFDEMLDLVVLAESILGNQLDLEKIMKGEQQEGYPVPEGMESTQPPPTMDLEGLLSREAADKPPVLMNDA